MFLNFKVVLPKFQKVKVFNLNWLILGDVTFVCIYLSVFKCNFSAFIRFHASTFSKKYFSIHLFQSLKQVSNDEHFHFRYSCTLQFLSNASIFLLLNKNVKNTKTSIKKHDYSQIVNENLKVIPFFTLWKVL